MYSCIAVPFQVHTRQRSVWSRPTTRTYQTASEYAARCYQDAQDREDSRDASPRDSFFFFLGVLPPGNESQHHSIPHIVYTWSLSVGEDKTQWAVRPHHISAGIHYSAVAFADRRKMSIRSLSTTLLHSQTRGVDFYFYFVLAERCTRSERIRKEQQQMGKKLNGEISYCMEQATKRGSGDDKDLGSARSRRDEGRGLQQLCGTCGTCGFPNQSSVKLCS